MKRTTTLHIALVLSIVAVSLMSSDSRVEAQNQIRIVADTGGVSLGPNQELVLTVLSGTPTANGTFNVRFRRVNYTQQSCSGGVCIQEIASQSVSDIVTVAPGEAATARFALEIPGLEAVRALVVSSSRDVKVNAMIKDTLTGEVVSFTTDLVIDVSG